MFLYFAVTLGLWLGHSDARAPSGPWDAFNYAPSSRTVHPKAVRSVHGSVQNSAQLVASRRGHATLTGNGSYVVLDFGQEVGGTTSLMINKAMPDSALSLSFTESSQFISPTRSDDSCHSVATMDSDAKRRVQISHHCIKFGCSRYHLQCVSSCDLDAPLGRLESLHWILFC